LYKPVGWVAGRLVDDAQKAMTEEKKPKRKSKKKKEKN
jgi:predicted GIY-YIG superfamily endonuclease